MSPYLYSLPKTPYIFILKYPASTTAFLIPLLCSIFNHPSFIVFIPFCVLCFYPTLIWLDFTVIFFKKGPCVLSPWSSFVCLFFIVENICLLPFTFLGQCNIQKNRNHLGILSKKITKLLEGLKMQTRRKRSETIGSSPPLKKLGMLSCHHHCQSQKTRETFFLPYNL